MLGASLALFIAGLLIAIYAVWRLGAEMDLVTGFMFDVLFAVASVLIVVGLFILGGIGLWAWFGA